MALVTPLSAEHDLETKELADELLGKITGGEAFESLASAHSKCPSGQAGGDRRRPGTDARRREVVPGEGDGRGPLACRHRLDMHPHEGHRDGVAKPCRDTDQRALSRCLQRGTEHQRHAHKHAEHHNESALCGAMQ